MPYPKHPKRDLVEDFGREGWTPTECSITFGINQGTISRWFKESEIMAPKRPGEQEPDIRKIEYDFVVRLRKAGFSYGEIENESIYGKTMIRKICANAGVP